jgi:hypothetical protein
VVPGGLEGDRVVAVLKMNHALADGGTFADLLDLVTGPAPGAPPEPPPIPRAATPASPRTALQDGVHDLWQAIRHEFPRRAGAVLRAYTRDKHKVAQRPPSRFGAPAVPWRGPLTPERSLTDRPVVANTAVRTRQDSDTRLWGTAVTALPFELPTHLSDPLARLHAAHAQTAMVKAQVATRPVHMEDWFDFCPPAILRPALRLARLAARRVNGALIISNVKGPREKRYIGGICIENFLSCGHLKYAAGVNTTIWSYDKLLNFTVYGCSRTLPDAELYTARILAVFNELRAATIGLGATASQTAV